MTNDMAKSLSEAKKDAINQANSFSEHFLKCILYKNSTGDLNKWINTLSEILLIVNKLEIKPDNKKLKKDFLKEHFLLGNLNQVVDVERIEAELRLNDFKDLSNILTDNDRAKIVDKYIAMSNELCEILSTKNTYNKDDFKQIINKYIL